MRLTCFASARGRRSTVTVAFVSIASCAPADRCRPSGDESVFEREKPQRGITSRELELGPQEQRVALLRNNLLALETIGAAGDHRVSTLSVLSRFSGDQTPPGASYIAFT